MASRAYSATGRGPLGGGADRAERLDGGPVVGEVDAPPGADAHAPARLAGVAGEGEEQDDRALVEVHVVVLAGPPGREDEGGIGGGGVPRPADDRIRWGTNLPGR